MAIRSGQINYVRNSVKATVDAYDGTVKLYQWDDKDPILTAWMKIFPDALTPLSEIKGSLMEHLRYPEDLFKIQRQLLTKYHETDASSFYGGQTFWRVPLTRRGTNAEQSLLQPAYYLSLAMPGQEEPAFSLTSTFMPVGDRNLLTGFPAADGDAAPRTGRGRPVTAGSDCSSRRAPRSRARGRSTTTCGRPRCPPATGLWDPGPVHLDDGIAGGRGHLGNQLTLPVGGGVLYVQPIYVQAFGSRRLPAPVRGSASPSARRSPPAGSLDGHCNDLFGGESGARPRPGHRHAGDPRRHTHRDANGTPTGTPTTGPTTSAPAQPARRPPRTPLRCAALADADAAFRAGEDALRKVTSVPMAAQRLKEALARAAAAAPEGR